MNKIKISNLCANVDNKPILNGVNLEIKSGEIHALMGPNGSGKSTLANIIMGHPFYTPSRGKILFNGINILELNPDERSRLRLFLAFQYPVEIPGITVGKFLNRVSKIHSNGKESISNFLKRLKEILAFLEIDEKFINRYLNNGFSGGEKKRMEICQMLVLNPLFAVLDETDSGLDIDALKIVSKGVEKLRGRDFSALVITHYQRILDHIKPDVVHVMLNGRIALTGDLSLVKVLEDRGYGWLQDEAEKKEIVYGNSPG